MIFIRRVFIAPLFLLLLTAVVPVMAQRADTNPAPVFDAPSAPVYGVVLEEDMIAMPDGIRLSVDLYMPTGGADDETFPVILEYDSYRKIESRDSDMALYHYFVERGYVVAKVDIRGSGNSEGILVPHEYSEAELADGDVIIDWLSKQSWSNGNVGMVGISWSGFNGIQMAVRQPPALKAVIAIDATEDLYQDDVHYIDGIIHVDTWEMTQELYNALPPSPDYILDEANFRDRFDTEPWTLGHKRQQRDGPYWDRASSRDKYDRIKIPIFHIGGWFDGYRDSLPRMLENVDAPVKAMIGPWNHSYPNEPYPEPGMEWRHEAVRWYDQWLKGRNTGIMDEPAFAVYVRDAHGPGPYLDTVPGKWRYEEGWPIDRIQNRRYNFHVNKSLSSDIAAPARHELKYVPTSGVESSGPVMWWGDLAYDQRPTDAFSLVYDSDVLSEDTEILGLPLANLKVSADAPQANWFVKLSDVAPDGTVTMITGAGRNGTHRNSAREPEMIVPGEVFPLDVELHFTSWVFPKGHRIRVSIGNAQWPMFWPTPYPMTTTLHLGLDDGSHILLPVVPQADRPVPEFLPPDTNAPTVEGYEWFAGGTNSGYGEISSVKRNPRTGEAEIVVTNEGTNAYPWGRQEYKERSVFTASDKDPAKASLQGDHSIEVTTGDRVINWTSDFSFSSDTENFYYHFVRRVTENGEIVREKEWNETIPRDHQ